MPPIPLSVLDLAPIGEGSRPRRRSVTRSTSPATPSDSAITRYWVAEHHNMPGIASAATAVVIAHIAAGTTTIRVGAGGIMLRITPRS